MAKKTFFYRLKCGKLVSANTFSTKVRYLETIF